MIQAKLRWVEVGESLIPPELRSLFDPAAGAGEPLPPERMAAIQGLVDASGKGHAPNVAAFPFQAWRVSAGNEIAYIADYEVRQSAASWVADPIVGVVHEGLTIEGVAAAMGESGVFCRVKARQCRVEDPIEPIEVELWTGGPSVEIEVPGTTTRERELPLAVRAGETRWIPFGFMSSEGEADRVGCGLLLTFEVVPTEEPAPPADRSKSIQGGPIAFRR